MNISIFGSGLMGFSIASRLLDQTEFSVTVFNRTLSKAEPLTEKGAFVTSDAGKALEKSDCLLLFLSDSKAIEDVIFQTRKEFSSKTIIQMGTISASESVSFQEKALNLGAQYLECPVLGSRKEALSGELILMVGSTHEQFLKWKDFFLLLGPNPRHVGDVGKAASLKLALNQLIVSYAVSFSLSLGIVRKKDVDVDIFSEILRESALYAPMFDKKLSKWLTGDYSNPNFSLKHLLKDVDLVLQEVTACGLSEESILAARQLVLNGLDKGLGELDYSSIYEAVVRKNNDIC